LNDLICRMKGVLLKEFVNTKGRSGSVALGCDFLPVLLEKIDNPSGSFKCLVGGVGYTCQEEV